MHKNIRRFTVEGALADDSYIIQTRDSNERLLLQQMEDMGYIPVLDLGSFWSTKYLPGKNIYELCLSAYGIFVGKREACKVYGITHGKLILRDTQTHKHPRSSDHAE
jgi:hypothetical protein